jgi:AraC family transcriptional regulator of adaptative response/methylated-DNA-[protein]-cysteine methyltransferase
MEGRYPNSLTPAEQSIRAALVHIENHLDQTPTTLKTLSRSSGLSPHHLQETFKKIVGLSPREFADYQRLSRFKERLRAGTSIADSCYEVGYGSSRALYEQTHRGLGMTPGAYRRGARGILIHYAIFRSTLGFALVAATNRGVCCVLIADDDAFLVPQLREEFPRATITRSFSPLGAVAADVCSVEDPLLLKLPRILRERVYQAKIWNCLKQPERHASWLTSFCRPRRFNNLAGTIG